MSSASILSRNALRPFMIGLIGIFTEKMMIRARWGGGPEGYEMGGNLRFSWTPKTADAGVGDQNLLKLSFLLFFPLPFLTIITRVFTILKGTHRDTQTIRLEIYLELLCTQPNELRCATFRTSPFPTETNLVAVISYFRPA